MDSTQVFRSCEFKVFVRALRAHARECHNHPLRTAAAQSRAHRFLEMVSSQVFRGCGFKAFGRAFRAHARECYTHRLRSAVHSAEQADQWKWVPPKYSAAANSRCLVVLSRCVSSLINPESSRRVLRTQGY